MVFTKTELKKFREDFEKAVKGLESEYKIKIHLGSISYGDIEFHSKMTATRTTAEAVEKSSEREKEQWELYADAYNMPKDLLNKPFVYAHKRYEVVGINPHARKNIVKILMNGKRFVTSPENIKTMLSISALTNKE